MTNTKIATIGQNRYAAKTAMALASAMIMSSYINPPTLQRNIFQTDQEPEPLTAKQLAQIEELKQKAADKRERKRKRNLALAKR